MSRKSPAALHRHEYAIFRDMLVTARKTQGLMQAEVALQLGKPQSFVSKYETAERRLDFTEFVDIAMVLKIDPIEFLIEYQTRINQTSTYHNR